MKFVLFYHSLLSDWNHGNAHFLRGIATELLARDHQVEIYEPAQAWSVQNLVAEHGQEALEDFRQAYPGLRSQQYELAELNLNEVLSGADIVIAHEWSDHALIAQLGEHRRSASHYRLLFHDTHHRALTARADMARYDLRFYDGVLAYGAILRELYLQEGWTKRAWTWHEASDTRLFHPHPEIPREGDVIWIGNWGDDERTAELLEFLIDPIRELGLQAKVHGVRYPPEAQQALAEAGIEYVSWIANFRVPEAFARYRMTLHVPRRPYVQALRGIPTIRPFEALACGIPLISAPWEDAEGLFRPGTDFLLARDGAEMKAQMKRLLEDEELAQNVAAAGLETILARHTCAHRVEELLAICEGL